MSRFLSSLCDSPGKMQSVEFSPSSFFRSSRILSRGGKKVNSVGTSKVQSCKSSPSKDPYEFVASPEIPHASMGSAAEDLSASSDSDSYFEQQKNSLQTSRPLLFGITDDEDEVEEQTKKIRQSINRILRSEKPCSKRFQRPKSLSAPHAAGSKLLLSRTSMSSPPKKQQRCTTETLRLRLASRAKRSLDYGQGKSLRRSVTPSEDLGKSQVMGEIGKMYWAIYEEEKENIHQNGKKESSVIFSELDDAENEENMKGAKHYGDAHKHSRKNMIPEAISQYQEEKTRSISVGCTWPSSSKKYPAQREIVLQKSTNETRKNLNPSMELTSGNSLLSEESVENTHNMDDLGSKFITAKTPELSAHTSNILPIFKDLDDADSELISKGDDQTRHCSPRSLERSEPECIGFPNPEGTNICWLNSGLQILLAMTPFLEDIEKLLKSSEELDNSSLLQNFIGLVRTRQKGQREEFYNFHRKFLKSFLQCSQFREEMQHDAGEFLSIFFEKLHEYLKKNGALREQDLNKLSYKKEDKLHRMLGTGEISQDLWSSPLRENLQHVLKEANFCLSCSEQLHGSTTNTSTFIYQCIPENSEQLSLQEILEQKQRLPEIKCKCGAFGARTEKSFSVLPRFLFFQMGRYDISRNKLGNKMTIPLVLTLKNLVDKDVCLPPPWEPNNTEVRCSWKKAALLSSVEEDEGSQVSATHALKSRMKQMEYLNDTSKDSDYKYRLIGIILHSGDKLTSGHYTADVFSLEKQRWYHYNDEEVFPEESCEVLGEKREREGYVFLYIHKKLFDQISQLFSYK